MRYFDPLFDRRSYTNLLYLIMSFPLGLLYFIFLITGFSLGLGLSFVLIGIPLLAVVIMLTWLAVGFERILANTLLGTNLPVLPSFNTDTSEDGLAKKLLATFKRMGTVRGIIYLFAKLPFGIFAFMASVMTLAFSFSFVAAPLFQQADTAGTFTYNIATLWGALIVSGIGVLIAPLLLRITNGITYVWTRFAVAMLTPPASAAHGYEKQKNKAKRPLVEVPLRDLATNEANDYFDEPEPKPKRVSQPETVSDDYFNAPTPLDPRSRKTLEELLNDNRKQGR